MRKLLALLSAIASPALAQTPAGVINAPIYATGYISQVGGTNVTTNIPPQPNHPTNLNIYTTDAISGTWTIKLPNPAFEGQMLSFNCGASVNIISIASSDGSSIDPNLPTSCVVNGGFVMQFDQSSNIWRSLGAGYSANFRPFTGVVSQWPWQLNADGTWTLRQPSFADLANTATQLFGVANTWTGIQNFGQFYSGGTPVWDGTGNQLQVAQTANTFLTNGSYGAVQGQRIASFTGGATGDSTAPVNGAVKGYSQTQSGVTYDVESAFVGVADNLSWHAQSVGSWASCKSWYGGRCWGEALTATEIAQSYTATAGQTIFTVNNGFISGGETVTKNGTALTLATDYTENSCSGTPSVCTGITLTSGAAVGDAINVWRGIPLQGLIGSEIDVAAGPGADTANPYSGNRIGLQLIGLNQAGFGIAHIGSMLSLATLANTISDRGIGFTGSGGIYNGSVGIDFTNTQFSNNAIYIPGPLSNGGNIAIGLGSKGSHSYAYETVGNSTTMPNGVGMQFIDNTSGTLDFRIFASGTGSIGEIGTFSNNGLGLFANSTEVIRLRPGDHVVQFTNAASIVAASNCGSLAGSTGCLRFVTPSGNYAYTPMYGGP